MKKYHVLKQNVIKNESSTDVALMYRVLSGKGVGGYLFNVQNAN